MEKRREAEQNAELAREKERMNGETLRAGAERKPAREMESPEVKALGPGGDEKPARAKEILRPRRPFGRKYIRFSDHRCCFKNSTAVQMSL